MKENTGGGRKYLWPSQAGSHFTWNLTEHLKRQVFLLNFQHSSKVLPWVTREGSYILPKWPYKPSFTTVLEVSTVRHLPLVVVIPAPINRWCSRDEELIKERIHSELAFASGPYTICKCLHCLVNTIQLDSPHSGPEEDCIGVISRCRSRCSQTKDG